MGITTTKAGYTVDSKLGRNIHHNNINTRKYSKREDTIDGEESENRQKLGGKTKFMTKSPRQESTTRKLQELRKQGKAAENLSSLSFH